MSAAKVCFGVGLLSACSAIAFAAEPLRYAGEKGKAIPYEVEIVADREDVVETLKGAVTFTLQSTRDSQLTVQYSGGLSKSQRQSNVPRVARGSGLVLDLADSVVRPGFLLRSVVHRSVV